MRDCTKLYADQIKDNDPIAVGTSDVEIHIIFKAVLTRTDMANTPSIFLQAIDEVFD